MMSQCSTLVKSGSVATIMSSAAHVFRQRDQPSIIRSPQPAFAFGIMIPMG